MAKGTTAKRAGSRSRSEDKFELKRTGNIELTMSGTLYRLGRPTIGEQRRFAEAIAEIAAVEREAMDADAAVAAAEESGETIERPDAPTQDDVNDALLAWWRDVVRTLADNGADFPEEDEDCAPWLLQRSLLGQVRQHWLTVPWVPGGSPEEQIEKQAQGLTPLLAQLAPLLAAQAQQPSS